VVSDRVERVHADPPHRSPSRRTAVKSIHHSGILPLWLAGGTEPPTAVAAWWRLSVCQRTTPIHSA